ncbi:methyltransferase of ATP-grasp peptide maturase system [Saccharomonospora amisosensis]|uniref:Protein-L-isoaspartate O-methyltransferase n=1 Tax=Saccharomonospora amisosensis TaxID=1128677 RepID=A0A7X5ZS37_9PSEU|nr:methyltransferase domain-containing protein [Saccharomonospora amisosensis]NIJ12955.1 methyltransferase of ATP-grasp peptide maturase system [Saccharomonospora amisosensis]
MTTTNTTTDVEWESHAQRLTDELAAAGKLTDPRLVDAVRAVPRHAFVPTYHQQTPDGSWAQRASVDDLAAVYANTALITALAPTATGGTTVLSSSTQPGLMTRMIEALHLTDGSRVLEVGTGTGYNAGLLAHRLGDEQVYSVDVEGDLVELARQRLAGLGYYPTLVAGDGAAGLPEHAPFDAIIATCAVPAIPRAWVEQVRPGGVILTDLKPAPGAGSLVRITRTAEDRAEGRFDATYAAFMDLRHTPGDNPAGFRVERDHDQAEHRTTSLDPNTPWNSLLVWFLASFELGAEIAYGYTLPEGGAIPAYSGAPPTASWIATPDGSWAEIALATQNGQHEVAEGGPRRLWRFVEQAHRTWTDLRRPGWDSFGLTVTPDTHTVWFDQADGEHTWRLAPR